jgi:hypothetical protein
MSWGSFDNALRHCLEYPRIAALHGASKFAASLWLNRGGASAFWSHPFSLQVFDCFQNSGDETFLHIQRSGGAWDCGAGNAPLGTWNHYGIRFDGTQAAADRFALLLDAIAFGAVSDTFDATTDAGFTTEPIRLGAADGNAHQVLIAEVGIWHTTIPSLTQMGYLADGYKPNKIGLTPAFYASLSNSGSANAEIGEGGTTATLVGSPAYNASHPTMQEGDAPGVGGGGGATARNRVMVVL